MSRKLLASLVGLVLTFLVIYLAFLNYLEAYQTGIERNLFTGRVAIQNADRNSGGFYLTYPWVQVARVDTRPVRECITSTARAYNCKLVQFEPASYREFVAVQGFRYYWFANRFSFNFGYSEEYRGMRDILRGYAFGVEKYPFITVSHDYFE